MKDPPLNYWQVSSFSFLLIDIPLPTLDGRLGLWKTLINICVSRNVLNIEIYRVQITYYYKKRISMFPNIRNYQIPSR